MDGWYLDQIDQVVADGLRARQMPGCVVMVGRRGKVVFLRAYGNRQINPKVVPMTTDTVFDLASLTKPVATATAVMLLVEAGKLRLEDPVSKHIPEFAQGGKEDITVLQLLTHQGGLVPDNALSDYDDGPKRAWERIFALRPHAKGGTEFVYSDVGYIVLAELVRRVCGKEVAVLCRERVFEPLGMADTGFLPGESLRGRAAPTERRDGQWMQGEVHDPRAYRLGGVAGHAGVFSTASDLGLYASMLLGRGEHGGVRVLGEATVETMTGAHPVPGGSRGLGWDIRTGYSSNRGEAFTARAFGHGGFTGTSMWIDPELDLFVIFLSNRLHPDGKGEVNSLAGRIGTIAGAALRLPGLRVEGKRGPGTRPAAGAEPNVLTGIDVLKEDGFRLLRGRRVGLITNQTGIDRGGAGTVKLLMDAPDVTLVKLFSPEHRFEGRLDQSRVEDARHGATGLKIISLYGQTRRPTKEMLADIDTLVFDIQDVGARFYTYVSTMGLAMQAAAGSKVRFVVLDRPNPINGVDVGGPFLDAGRESFVAFHRLPVRHGMTVGELAMLFRAELGMDLDLHVVPVRGWRREDFYDATGLRWVNPSPNMRSLTEAMLYPGIGLLEATNLSVGRGTDTPFEVIGSPWVDELALGQALSRSNLPGVRFVPVRFTPASSKFAGESCGGVNIVITNRREFRAVCTGLEVARQLHALYPVAWEARGVDHLMGNRKALEALLSGKTVPEIEWAGQTDLDGFLKRRAAVLLYK
jgi:uncharacterized protein YbbC (DUF1343 family)/CubicO group peptidase (beta-lactamase class C family)